MKYIVIHCSDSPQGRVDGAGEIHQWHVEKGWAGIGYHAVIDEEGLVMRGRPVFPETKTFWAGAHVRGHNHESIGICLIGIDDFTLEQMSALRSLVFDYKRSWPDAEVVGHCDLDDRKTCPNFDVKNWYKHGWHFMTAKEQ